MSLRVEQTNFTGGELNSTLSSRYDLAKFKSSARHLENFIPELHGPISRRPGSYFLEDLGSAAVLIPFKFSSDPSQNFVLVLQERKLRIANDQGFVRNAQGVPLELPAPYLAEQLYDVSYAQSGDIVYLAHTAHRPRKLVRNSNTDWTLREVKFLPEIQAPQKVVVSFEGTAGGYNLKYKVCAVDDNGRASEASLGQQPNGKHVTDWVQGDCAKVYWPAVAGATSYNIYRQDAGIYGLVGVLDLENMTADDVENVNGEELFVFLDNMITADQNDTPSIPQDPFVDGNNPGTVCFHQQRLILGAPYLEPQKWYGSRTGNFEDFSKSRPIKDDDCLEFTLASGRIDAIQWAIAFGDLLIGTSGSEYKAVGADMGVITPSSLNVREQSYWGSIKLRPLVMGNSVLHVQRQGSRVRDLFYSLETDGYVGNDLSVMASGLFERHFIRQWDYQQSPGSNVWCVRDDGLMLVLTYLKEHDIWAWNRVSTQGRYRSVACLAGRYQDIVYTVVEREVQGPAGAEPRFYLERFKPKWHAASDGIKEAFFLDCGLSTLYDGRKYARVGGLDHLEGCLVDILADGSVLAPRRVQNGYVDLDFEAELVHVGLNYVSKFSPQTPEATFNNGTTLGRVRIYSGNTMLRLLDSVGGHYGDTEDTEYSLQFLPVNYNEAIEPFSGDYFIAPDGAFSSSGALWISQKYPLPFTLAALVLDVDFEG